jgi:hypothetical protein
MWVVLVLEAVAVGWLHRESKVGNISKNAWVGLTAFYLVTLIGSVLVTLEYLRENGIL